MTGTMNQWKKKKHCSAKNGHVLYLVKLQLITVCSPQHLPIVQMLCNVNTSADPMAYLCGCYTSLTGSDAFSLGYLNKNSGTILFHSCKPQFQSLSAL